MSYDHYPEDVAAAEGILRQTMATLPDDVTPAEAADRIHRAMIENGYEGVQVHVEPYDEGLHVTMSRGAEQLQKPGLGMTVGEGIGIAFATLVFIGMATALVALVWRLAS